MTTIVKNEEYEQNKRLLAKNFARVTMIPPVHTGLPRDVSGTVMRINDDGDSYDIMLDATPEQ